MPRKKGQHRPRSKWVEQMDPEVLDAEAAGRMLGVSKWLVLKLARLKKLPGMKVGKEWRFQRSRLIRWLGEGGKEKKGSNAGEGMDLVKLLESGRAQIIPKSRG